MTISLKNIEISTRFSIFQGADFRNFRKSGFPKVWTHHYTRFFMEISKKSIRKAYLQANERLWANYIFYKKSEFLKICFPDRKMDFLRGEPIFGLKNRELKIIYMRVFPGFSNKKPSKNLKKTFRRPRKFWKTLKKPSRGPLKPSKNSPRRHFWRFWL